jgi:phage-related protein
MLWPVVARCSSCASAERVSPKVASFQMPSGWQQKMPKGLSNAVAAVEVGNENEHKKMVYQ